MKNQNKINKLAELDLKPMSKWIAQSDERLANSNQPSYSQLVAVRILRTLREKGLRQKDLAELLSVSPQTVNKWVKGSENFTLDTIDKIDKVLNIRILNIYKNVEMVSTNLSSSIKVSGMVQNKDNNPLPMKSNAMGSNKSKVIQLTPYYIIDEKTPELNYSNS